MGITSRANLFLFFACFAFHTRQKWALHQEPAFFLLFVSKKQHGCTQRCSDLKRESTSLVVIDTATI